MSRMSGSITIARGEGDALLLAPRQVSDGARTEFVEPHAAPAPSPTRTAISAAGETAHAQAVGDVLEDVHVREQGVVLEHHADVALACGERRVMSRPPMLSEPAEGVR